METQLRFVSKEEAHKMIDESPGEGVFIITYNGIIGLSDSGRYIRKKKGKKLVDKSPTIVLQKSNLVAKLNLHKNYFTEFDNYNREDTIKSILLTQLE